MATHSSILAWRILWTQEPGGLLSMGSTELDTTKATWHACMHWRRKWQPTPIFLPGESQGWMSLVGCRLWGRTETDTTEATWQQQLHCFFASKGTTVTWLPPHLSGPFPWTLRWHDGAFRWRIRRHGAFPCACAGRV